MDNIAFNKIKTGVENKCKNDFADKLYLCALCVLIAFFNASSTTFDIDNIPYLARVCSLIRYTALFVILLKGIFLSGYTYKQLAVFTAASGLLFVSAYYSKDKNLLLSLIAVFGAKGCSIKKIAKAFLYCYTAITLSVVFLYFVKLLPEAGFFRADTPRYAIGFNHPNLTGRMLLIISTSFVVVSFDKMEPVYYLFIAGMAAFSFFVPASRASALCIAFLIALCIIFKIAEKKKTLEKAANLFAYIFSPTMAFFSFIGAFLYSSAKPLMVLLDNFSSQRLSFSHACLEKFGISIFGRDILASFGDEFAVDNCYIRLAVSFGVIALLLYLAANCFLTFRALKNKHYEVIIAALTFAAFGIFEIHSYYAVYNLALFALCAELGRSAQRQ